MGFPWKRSTRCSSGGCVEVRHNNGRVVLRDSKLGDDSPELEFTPAEWDSFLAAAVEWDRDSEMQVGPVVLDRVGGDYPVCIVGDQVAALHYSWEEWADFRVGAEAGEFRAGVLAG